MQDVLTESDRTYDVIAIDNGSNRYEVARAALTRLAPGGLIILDNAEWYYQTAGLLRDHGLIEVDFAGFKPTEFHTSVTSLFLHPEFQTKPKRQRHPDFPIGGKRNFELAPQDWDKPIQP